MSFITELNNSIAGSLQILRTSYDPDSEESKDAFARVQLALHILPRRRAEIMREARLIIPTRIGFFSIVAFFLPERSLNSPDDTLANAIFDYFESALDCQKPTDLIVAWQAVGYLWKIKGRETQIIDLCQRKIIALTKRDRSSLVVSSQPLRMTGGGTAFTPAGAPKNFDLGSAIADHAIINLGHLDGSSITDEAFDACVTLKTDDLQPYLLNFLIRMAGDSEYRKNQIRRISNQAHQDANHQTSQRPKALSTNLPEEISSELYKIDQQLAKSLIDDDDNLEIILTSVSRDTLIAFIRKLLSLIRGHVNSYKQIKSERRRRIKIEQEDVSIGYPSIRFVHWLTKLCNHLKDTKILSALGRETFKISRGLYPLGNRPDLIDEGYVRISVLALTLATQLDPRQAKRFLNHGQDDIEHFKERVTFLGNYGLLNPKLAKSLLTWSMKKLSTGIKSPKEALRAIQFLEIITYCLKALKSTDDFQLAEFLSAGKQLRKISTQLSGSNVEFSINFGLDFFSKQLIEMYAEEERPDNIDRIVDSLGMEVLL
jgi:hypothetical protein